MGRRFMRHAAVAFAAAVVVVGYGASAAGAQESPAAGSPVDVTGTATCVPATDDAPGAVAVTLEVSEAATVDPAVTPAVWTHAVVPVAGAALAADTTTSTSPLDPAVSAIHPEALWVPLAAGSEADLTVPADTAFPLALVLIDTSSPRPAGAVPAQTSLEIAAPAPCPPAASDEPTDPSVGSDAPVDAPTVDVPVAGQAGEPVDEGPVDEGVVPPEAPAPAVALVAPPAEPTVEPAPETDAAAPAAAEVEVAAAFAVRQSVVCEEGQVRVDLDHDGVFETCYDPSAVPWFDGQYPGGTGTPPPPGSVSPAGANPPVAGQTGTPGGDALAHTGAGTTTLLAVGLLALLTGAALTRTARRRAERLSGSDEPVPASAAPTAIRRPVIAARPADLALDLTVRWGEAVRHPRPRQRSAPRRPWSGGLRSARIGVGWARFVPAPAH